MVFRRVRTLKHARACARALRRQVPAQLLYPFRRGRHIRPRPPTALPQHFQRALIDHIRCRRQAFAGIWLYPNAGKHPRRRRRCRAFPGGCFGLGQMVRHGAAAKIQVRPQARQALSRGLSSRLVITSISPLTAPGCSIESALSSLPEASFKERRHSCRRRGGGGEFQASSVWVWPLSWMRGRTVAQRTAVGMPPLLERGGLPEVGAPLRPERDAIKRSCG